MAEQLFLGLEAGLPRPGALAPMEALPCPAPFDDADHLYEPAWGGRRVLVFLEPGGSVRLVDAGGADHAPRLPEFAGTAAHVAAASAVLDGELVAVDASGRMDAAALAARLGGAAGRPLALLVSDLLHLDGRWLLRQPLERRRALLRRVVRPADVLLVVPAVAGEGRALHAAAAAQGLAGILARHRASPYLPGVRSGLWRAIPARPPAGAGEPAAAPPPVAPVAPVLALFQRLPLPEEPDPDAAWPARPDPA